MGRCKGFHYVDDEYILLDNVGSPQLRPDTSRVHACYNRPEVRHLWSTISGTYCDENLGAKGKKVFEGVTSVAKCQTHCDDFQFCEVMEYNQKKQRCRTFTSC